MSDNEALPTRVWDPSNEDETDGNLVMPSGTKLSEMGDAVIADDAEEAATEYAELREGRRHRGLLTQLLRTDSELTDRL